MSLLRSGTYLAADEVFWYHYVAAIRDAADVVSGAKEVQYGSWMIYSPVNIAFYSSVGYFGGFESIKRGLTPKGKDPSDLNAFRVFVAGGFAGIINWVIAIPPDVVKSRIQTAPEGTYRGITHCFQVLMKQEGPGALFNGVGPAMARAFPANAACFLGVGT